MVACAGICLAADWPQFQGPGRSGISPETGLASTFPAGGPKVLWTNEKLGKGYGGCVVQGGRIYILDRVNNESDVLRCLDPATGKQEWAYTYKAVGENGKGTYKMGYNGSRNMPAVDEKNVYILGPFGDLACVSKETHDKVWAVNLIKDYGAALGNWGMCQSPALYKDNVIVAPLSKQAGVVAFDKATGKEAWKSEALGGIAYTSPAISAIDGTDQVVILCNRDEPRLVGLDAAGGKKLWMYDKWACPNPIANPTDCGQGRFFITGGYQAGCAMVQVKKDGDAWQVKELFRSKDCGAQACKPIFYKDHIYAKSNDFLVKDKKEANGVMCMDLDGKVQWKVGCDNDEELGSILIADGKLYSFSSEKGTLKIYQASPDSAKELASAKIAEGMNLWAPMALADGKLLVRCGGNLYCLDVKGEGK